MKARLRTLVVLLIMGVCLIGDVAINAQAQTYRPGQYRTARRREYRHRLALARQRSHRRQRASRMLRQRHRITLLNRRHRRSLYNRRRHPRAWAIWARRNRAGRRANWRTTHPRAWSIWARRNRRHGRGRNWTPGIPRGRRRDGDHGERHRRDRD
jgi:hypothetical protein